MVGRNICVVIAMTVLVGNSSVLPAQGIFASLSGSVTDQTGAAVSGAKVAVKNLDTGEVRETVTTAEGKYTVLALLAGTYSVTVLKEGFKTQILNRVPLEVRQQAALDIRLQVGAVEQSVTVEESIPVLQTQSSDISTVVGDKVIRELPLNGRDYFQLTNLEPGVRPSLNAGPNVWAQGGITKAAISGQRPTGNNMTLDGTDINDPTYNIPPGGASGAALGVEAIKEFRLVSSTASAEYGRNLGAVVVAVTRSGGNTFHGSLFEFLRNSALDAKNYFDSPKQPIPPFKRNQFGATFGGRLKRDKAFFFVNYEGLRERLGRTSVATVPDLQARQGLLPDRANPGKLINVGVNPAVQPFLALYPAPNAPPLGDGTALLTTFGIQPTGENYLTGRIDYQFASDHSFFGRYTFDDSSTTNPFIATLTPGFPGLQSRRNQFMTLSDTLAHHGTLNEFRFGFNRTVYAATAANQGGGLSISLQPNFPFLGTVITTGLSAIGNSGLWPVSSAGNTFQVVDNITLIRAHHTIKFGGDVRRVQMNGIFDSNAAGSYVFTSLRDFLTGTPFSYSGMAPGSNSNRGFRQNQFGFFVQDDFIASPSLTLNMGLRYEFNTTPTEVNGRITNLHDLVHDTAIIVGGPLYNAPKKMFAPRFGFVWKPFGSEKIVVRGGYGVFFDQIWMNIYGNTRFNQPFFTSLTFFSPVFPDPTKNIAGTASRNASAVEFNPHQPTAMQYNLAVQRQLSPTTAVQVAYVGSRGVHLLRQRQMNVKAPIVQPDGKLFFPAVGPRINPNFGGISYLSTDTNSLYNSLQAVLKRTPAAGVSYQVSYTWSKSVDDVSGPYPTDWTTDPGVPQNPFDRRDGHAVSSFDITHMLVSSFTYELPFGQGKRWKPANPLVSALVGNWGINGILPFYTGTPFTVTVGFDRARALTPVTIRPNLAGPERILGSPLKWFDTSAYALQPAGFYGNLGRNTLRGPKIFNPSLSLLKTMRIQEKLTVEFRTEFFNFINHPNFAAPNNTRDPTGAGGAGDAIFASDGTVLGNAGKIFSTVTTSRQIQFGLKLSF